MSSFNNAANASKKSRPNSDLLESVETCPICAGDDRELYNSVPDRLIEKAKNFWDFRQCISCRHAWLPFRFKPDHIHLAYDNYSDLHWPEERPFSGARWKQKFKDAYFAAKYGYSEGVSNPLSFLGHILAMNPRLSQKFARQVRFLSAQNRGRLLDVGSGNGWFLQNMQRLGWQVEGLDIDVVSAEKARKRGVHIQVGTLEKQTYKDNHFDAITLSHVIEHVHEPIQALQECHRILKPGAKIVVLTPNLDSFGHRIFKQFWLNLDPPRHLHIFTFESLRLAVQEAGFEIDNLSSTGYRAVGTWIKSNMIKSAGHYRPKEPAQDWRAKLLSLGFYLWENSSLLYNRKAGEEIIIIASKPQNILPLAASDTKVGEPALL